MLVARDRRAPQWLLFVVLTAWVGVSPAAAQDERPITPAAPRDFLFGRPKADVGIRAGWSFVRGRSDWYDFVRDELTLGRRSFDGVTVGSDVGVWVSDRASVLIGAEVSHRQTPSEYRRLVDNNRNAIEQDTRLVALELTGGLKYALTPRGRHIGALAWIPRRTVPYVAAGGGGVFFSLRQEGDFVDFADSRVFRGQFSSSGWAPLVYVGGGTDIRLSRSLQLTTDVRYRVASARLSRTWEGFDPLDLAGVRVTTGAAWQF